MYEISSLLPPAAQYLIDDTVDLLTFYPTLLVGRWCMSVRHVVGERLSVRWQWRRRQWSWFMVGITGHRSMGVVTVCLDYVSPTRGS
jgi:hypothetical protein